MTKQWMRVLLVAVLGMAVMTVVGCKKEEGASTTTTQPKQALNTKCPVCGMTVGDSAVTAEVEGHKVAFCSDGCKEKCLAAPEEYKAKIEEMMEAAQETVEEGMEQMQEGAEEAGKKLDEMKEGMGI